MLSLMVANADGSGLRALTEPSTELSWFDWSPNGSQIAYIHDFGALTVVNVDGSGSKTLDLGRPAPREAVPAGTGMDRYQRPGARQTEFGQQRGGGGVVVRLDRDGDPSRGAVRAGACPGPAPGAAPGGR
mgnify:CR=1 FL=1